MQKFSAGNSFEKILEVVRDLPLWVLQALQVEVNILLKEKESNINLEKYDRTDMIQLFVPVLSKRGQVVLKYQNQEGAKQQVSPKMLQLLNTIPEKKNMVDICIINDWTLRECCELIAECIETELIEQNYSPIMHSYILFIANKIRIGEFLMRKNIINESQLQWALQMQNDMGAAFDEKNKIVEVLVNIGYITHEDVSEYLSIKEYADFKIRISDFSKIYLDEIEKAYKRYNDTAQKFQEVCKQKDILENEVIQLRKKNLTIQTELQEAQKSSFFKKL